MRTKDKYAILAVVLILTLAILAATNSKGQMIYVAPAGDVGCAKFMEIRPHTVEFCTNYNPPPAETAYWKAYGPLDSVIIKGGAGVVIVVDGKVVYGGK